MSTPGSGGVCCKATINRDPACYRLAAVGCCMGATRSARHPVVPGGLSFAGWRCARSLAGRASSSRYHRPVLRIWVAVLDITDEVAHKLNQLHSITTHEVRDAVQCRQGLSVRRKWDPQRGLRWYVEVRIRNEQYLVVLRQNPWDNDRYKVVTCYRV